MQRDDTDTQDQEIQALLKDYPIPAASADFYDQALARATHEGSRRQRNRWMLAGFGSAVAAGLVLWMIGSLVIAPATTPAPEQNIPAVAMTLEERRTINLVFASKEPLDMATLTVRLPHGVEMQGFPGQREVTWETSLDAGRNLLPLRLVATAPVGGDVFATLQHDDRGRTFRLRIDVS